MKDIINNRKPPGVTEYTILGPFHRKRAGLPLGSGIAGDIPGEPVIVQGSRYAPGEELLGHGDRRVAVRWGRV